eukprot:33580-Chlamydomonas_euryale.AAC.2
MMWLHIGNDVAGASAARAWSPAMPPTHCAPRGPPSSSPRAPPQTTPPHSTTLHTPPNSLACSSRFVASRPPMSSHVVLGTSTTVSRSALGLDMPSAVLKWSCVCGGGEGAEGVLTVTHNHQRLIYAQR